MTFSKTSINKHYFISIIFIILISVLANAPHIDADSNYEIEYFISINYIPVGSIDVTINPSTGKMSVESYNVNSYRNRQLAEAVVDIMRVTQKLCIEGRTRAGYQALTYFAGNNNALFVVKADRSVHINERVYDAILEAKSYYPYKYCIPLFGNIQVYRNNQLINELRYTVVSSSNPLPGSKPVNTGLTRLVILSLASLLTIIALAVITRAWKYRIL